MFYKTRIKSVSNGSAVDVNGRRLTFIGWLPVKAGDTVFTDGKVIFGNAPPKGSPAIFDEPSGIPVLGDKDSSGNELRGYFNKQGKYKKYSIKGDEWIVNSDKTYWHDNGEENIIDAEISDDGNLYTVEKKIIESDTEDEDFIYRYQAYRHIMYSLQKEDIEINNGTDSMHRITWYGEGEPLTQDILFEAADYARYDDDIFKVAELIFKKDGENISALKLSDLLKKIEDETLKNVTAIQAGEPEDHIKSRAVIKNVKIKDNGEWETLILCEIWAERGFKYKTSTSWYNSGHVVIRRTVTETPLEEHWKIHEERTDISISKMPSAEIIEGYSSTMAHEICLVKITSAGEQNKV